MKKFILVASMLLLGACTQTKQTTETKSEAVKESIAGDTCDSNVALCSSVEMDAPNAKLSYDTGCKQNDGRSCYRLGEYLEKKESDLPNAAKAYDASCANKFEDGCKEAKKIHATLSQP